VRAPPSHGTDRSARLAVRTYGQGEPLVLLHGLLGSSAHWHHIAMMLARECEVLAVDLRNHGASPHTETMDYPGMAADVLSLLDERGLSQASIVGHSMGGKVAMSLALLAPHRVRRLSVIDIAPADYADAFTPLLATLLNLDLQTIGSREEADRRLAGRIASRELRAMLLQNLVRRDGAWAWRVHLAAIARSLPALLGFPRQLERLCCEVPALFVHGGASDYLQARHKLRIEALFPQARFHCIEGAGHWVQADRPAELAAVLRDWAGARLP
jgi:esterase